MVLLFYILFVYLAYASAELNDIERYVTILTYKLKTWRLIIFREQLAVSNSPAQKIDESKMWVTNCIFNVVQRLIS